MWIKEQKFAVILGNCRFINCETIISYEDQPFFTIQRSDTSGELGISFDIYDESSSKIAVVKQNRIYKNIHASPDDYVIDTGQKHYRMTEKATGRLLCSVIKIDSNDPFIAELHLYVNLYTPDGILFEATPGMIRFPKTDNVISGLTFEGIGIYLSRGGYIQLG